MEVLSIMDDFGEFLVTDLNFIKRCDNFLACAAPTYTVLCMRMNYICPVVWFY